MGLYEFENAKPESVDLCDWFAAQSMMVAAFDLSRRDEPIRHEAVAREAYKYAREMMLQRNKYKG